MSLTIHFNFQSDVKTLKFQNSKFSMTTLLQHVGGFYSIPLGTICISFGHIWHNYNSSKNLTIRTSGLLDYLSETNYDTVKVSNEPPPAKLSKNVLDIINKEYGIKNIVSNSLIQVQPSLSVANSQKCDDMKGQLCIIMNCRTKEDIGDTIIFDDTPYVATELLHDGSGVLFTGNPFSFKCADFEHRVELASNENKHKDALQKAEVEFNKAQEAFNNVSSRLEELEKSITIDNSLHDYTIREIGEVFISKKQSSDYLAICQKIYDDLKQKKLPGIDLNRTVTIQKRIQIKLKYGHYKMASGTDIWVLPSANVLTAEGETCLIDD